MNLSHVGTVQNEVKSCNLCAAELPRITTCAHFHMGNQTILHSKMVSDVNCKGNIHCNQRGHPSHAAVEGKGCTVLHHEPNLEQLDDSAEGLRRSGKRHWFIIYEQD